MYDIFPFQENFSGSRTVEGCQYVEKGSFSGTGFSHNCDKFTLFYRKSDVGKCLHFVSAETCAVYFFDVSYFK